LARHRLIDDEKTATKINLRLILRLFTFFKPYKSKVLAALMLVIITTVLGLIMPYLLSIAIDKYISGRNLSGLLLMGLIMLSAYTLSMFLSRIHIRIISTTSRKIIKDIREKLFAHIQTMSFSFFDNRPSGKILARVIGDINSLQQLFNNTVTNLLPDTLLLCGVVTIMLFMHWQLALASLIMLPVLAVSISIIKVFSERRWQDVRKKASTMNAFIHESFSGVRVIQSFRQEKDSLDMFTELADNSRRSWLSAIRVNDILWPLVELSWGLGTILVYWSGIRLIYTGGITVGLLTAFAGYVGMFWHPIINLGNYYNMLISSLTAAERIFEIMDLEPEIKDNKGAIPIGRINGRVTFENISFGYEDGQVVLDDVSFDVRPGETVALVGETGAGKTTIINLISRFYDPTSGRVLLDGKDIRDHTLESVRSQMGIMMQDTFLFSTSVMENIRYGRPDASDEEVIEAAKAVHAHDFITELKNGYETNVNERGSRLSVGQRQLLSFARAILANPRILILDEATSSIDTNTEILVQNALKKLLQGRTSFIIAHRLSTIRGADRIMVVHDGKVTESGSHDELMAARGMYYELCVAQYRYAYQDRQRMIAQ
jgi:ATP-binding cassette subfamily B protein